MILYVPHIGKVWNLVNPFANRYSDTVPNSDRYENDKHYEKSRL